MPAEEFDAASTRTVSLSDIQREWPRILRHVSKVLNDASAAALAREGRPAELSDSVLVIAFGPKWDMHARKTQEKADVISRGISEVLGANLKIRAEHRSEPAAPEPAKAAPAEPVKSEPEQHPMLNDVVTMFDGTVVQDDHDPWEEEK